MCPAEDPIKAAGGSEQPVVLLVEDEVMVRLAAADHLRQCGYKVVEAANGAEAQALVLSGVTADLVFSDISMPGGVDGMQLALWLHDNGVTAPVILTSGLGSALDAARKACANVRAFVPKPYDHDDITGKIRAALAEREDD